VTETNHLRKEGARKGDKKKEGGGRERGSREVLKNEEVSRVKGRKNFPRGEKKYAEGQMGKKWGLHKT